MSWSCTDIPCRRPDCPYDLWAPSHRSKDTNVGFSTYAYHQQGIEDFINALAATEDPNDYGVQREIARSLSINMDDFTDADIKYIEREVAKRW